MAERDDQGRKTARRAPWLLLGPGLLFLFFFFFFPLYTLFRMSLSASPTRFSDPAFHWEWGNYSNAFSQYGDQFIRSFEYALVATLLALVIAYPLAYVIAFRGGRFKSILLGLVVVPFFTNFLIRTLAWKTILGDQGVVVGHPARSRDPRLDGRAAAHADRGGRRAHLQLPAVHGAADLRGAGEDRPAPDRRGA